MHISKLPNKAAYAQAMRNLRDFAKRNPSGQVKISWCDTRDVKGAVVETRKALNLRINARGGLPTRWDDDLQDRWKRDKRAIEDYRLHRIVRRGSGLETKAGRKVAPDVHSAFTCRDW